MKAIAAMYDPQAYSDELAPLVGMGYSIHPIRIPDENIAPDRLIPLVKGYPYIIASGEYYPAEVLKTLRENGLRMIVRMGVGCDHIDVRAARELGVCIANTPGANANAVAEQALMLTFACARCINASRKAVEQGAWENRPWPTDLLGSTFGVLGFGNIAKHYIRYVRPLAARILAYDPYPNAEDAEKLGVELVSLDEILEASDVISLHLPLTAATRNLIDHRALSRVKPNLILINTSRGHIIDEDALYDALSQNRILAAGLDVYTAEPLPPDDKLQRLDNCVLMPHNASFSRAAFSAMMTCVVKNLTAHIQGLPVPYQAPLSAGSLRPG